MNSEAQSLKQQILSLSKKYYDLARPDVRRTGYIPVSGKVLGSQELSNMMEASLDMWLTGGRFNEKFERAFADFLGLKHAFTTTSGSSANLLAVSALTSYRLGERRLQKGDEVITVAAGFPTTVNPIVQCGLVPVFCDVEIGTYNIDVQQIKEAISPRTRAIIIAHTLGNVFDLDKITGICAEHKLWLIEDSCDALGAQFDGKRVGTFGDISTYSFYPAHHITMGEGGAVCTDNALLSRIILSMRDWGRDCWCAPGRDDTCGKRFSQTTQYGNMPKGYDHKYIYSHLGYNLKITDWQAACGLAQLERIDGFIAKRNENFDYLHKALEPLEDVFVLPRSNPRVTPSWFGFVLTVKDTAPFDKGELVRHLEQNGIGTRSVFAGNLLRQPLYAKDAIALRIRDGELKHSNELQNEDYARLPNTETVMNSSFWIGVWPGLSQGDLQRMVEVISRFIESRQ